MTLRENPGQRCIDATIQVETELDGLGPVIQFPGYPSRGFAIRKLAGNLAQFMDQPFDCDVFLYVEGLVDMDIYALLREESIGTPWADEANISIRRYRNLGQFPLISSDPDDRKSEPPSTRPLRITKLEAF